MNLFSFAIKSPYEHQGIVPSTSASDLWITMVNIIFRAPIHTILERHLLNFRIFTVQAPPKSLNIVEAGNLIIYYYINKKNTTIINDN